MIAELKIVLQDNGALHLEGCINNPLMAYGLLGLARDAIQKHQEESRKIQPPGPNDLAQIIGPRRIGG